MRYPQDVSQDKKTRYKTPPLVSEKYKVWLIMTRVQQAKICCNQLCTSWNFFVLSGFDTKTSWSYLHKLDIFLLKEIQMSRQSTKYFHKCEIVYLQYIEIHECLCPTDIAQTVPLLIFWSLYLPFLGFVLCSSIQAISTKIVCNICLRGLGVFRLGEVIIYLRSICRIVE